MIAAVPVLLFSTAMIRHLVEAKRDASERLLIKTADELALAFDQEVLATIRTLQGMSMSQALKSGNLRKFHQEISDVLTTQPSWSTIIVHDDKTNWLMSALLPYGTKLPAPPEPETLKKVIESGEPLVGRVIAVDISNRIGAAHGFAVRVPVKDKSGRVLYVLSAVLSTKPIQDLFNRFAFAPGEWVRAIVDSDGVLAARSRDAEKFVGGPASETLRNILADKERGIEVTMTLEHVRAYTAYRRAPFSKWYAAIAVPASVFEASARETQQTFILIALLIVCFSAATTLLFSRWLKLSLSSGSEGAAALAKGEEPVISLSRIREVEELRNSLLSASQLLRSRDRLKSDFLANMSHELRTPLGIVLGMTDLISKDLIADADRTKSWGIIRRNGQQLLRLIDDILDFSKAEAHMLTVEHLQFSLRDLVSSVVEDLKATAEDKHIDLKVVFEAGAPEIVNTDPVRVRQVVLNLISNAVKFTLKGTVEVRLHRSENNMVRISVTDTGVGLSTEQQELLFLDFTQGDSSHTRKFGGTGLGLSLSRKVARLLGGDVRLVKSESAKGSTFEATFKTQVDAEAEATTTPAVGRKLDQNVIPSGTRILLAEDSPDNVTLIEAYLKHSGAQVFIAENGVQALKMVKEQTFDLILMDIQMPDMDGYEATRRLREQGNKTPIIALTAHALGEQKNRALKAGFSGYVTKPIQRQMLIETIGRLI